jgi:hypothetical protein
MNTYELDQKNWGVCGFVSAIQAAWSNGKLDKTAEKDSYKILLPKIENFCNKNQGLHEELKKFTEVFGEEFKYPSLEHVVEEMKKDTTMSKSIGIAMTGKAMSKLCKDLKLTNTDFHGTTSTTNELKFSYRNTIYGLGKREAKGNFRYGLLHWVYVDNNGDLMTWGKKINSADAIEFLNKKGYDKITHYLPSLV